MALKTSSRVPKRAPRWQAGSGALGDDCRLQRTLQQSSQTSRGAASLGCRSRFGGLRDVSGGLPRGCGQPGEAAEADLLEAVSGRRFWVSGGRWAVGGVTDPAVVALYGG